MKHLQKQHRCAHPRAKIVVITAIVLSTVTLTALHLRQMEAQARLQALQDQTACLEAENAELDRQIQSVGSVEFIRRIALEELHLVDPGTIIIEESE